MSANLEVGKHSHKCCHGDGVRIDEAIARYERMTEMAKAEYEKWKSKASMLDEATRQEVEWMFDGLIRDTEEDSDGEVTGVWMWLPSMDIDEDGYVKLNIEVNGGYVNFLDE